MLFFHISKSYFLYEPESAQERVLESMYLLFRAQAYRRQSLRPKQQ